MAGRLLGQRPAGGDRDGDDPLQPARPRAAATPQKVDVVGGLLLAIALGLAVVGLYNPAPDGKQLLPQLGRAGADRAPLVATVAFFVWEKFARTRLIEPAGVNFRPFLAALGASLAAGAALMVTLVNVELFGQGVLGQDQNEAALLLLRFLVALPVGALLGGWLATRIGDRIVAFAGLLDRRRRLLLISHWPVDRAGGAPRSRTVRPCRRWTPTWRSPAWARPGDRTADLGDARVVPAAQHGIASAAVVVARMTGMLIGVAALSAWGLYRFNQIWPACPPCRRRHLAERLAAEAGRYREAYAMQYGEIFAITAIVCVVGAVLGLLISGRDEHAEEPEQDIDSDDTPSQMVDALVGTVLGSSHAAGDVSRPPMAADGVRHRGDRHRPGVRDDAHLRPGSHTAFRVEAAGIVDSLGVDACLVLRGRPVRSSALRRSPRTPKSPTGRTDPRVIGRGSARLRRDHRADGDATRNVNVFGAPKARAPACPPSQSVVRRLHRRSRRVQYTRTAPSMISSTSVRSHDANRRHRR